AVGNFLTALITKLITTPDGESRLAGADYYWLFAGIMLAAAVAFVGVSRVYLARSSETPAAA
ncbi:MAG TPA: hypothetical protein VHY91_14900, partial [Pirellulales bacterium]|nr:hypothetical protein [Pirellulales bacterium]